MYPTLEELLIAEDKTKLLEVRRAFRSNIVPFSILGLTLLGVIALFVNYPDARFPDSIPAVGGASLRWLAVLPAVVLLEIIRRYHDDLYIFGIEKVTHYEGRLSLNSSVPSLKYSDIKAIQVEQTIPGRLLNFGNVLLDSAAQDGAELVISGVLSPLELAKLVERLRDPRL
jgi:hypothetical protein